MRQHGLHHIHLRKRIHQKYEPYPHPNKWMNFMDRFLIIVAVIGPLTTAPQIYDIFWTKSVNGLSFWTWLLYSVLSIPWLFYGLVHRDKPLIISSILWVILQGIVAAGILIYS